MEATFLFVPAHEERKAIGALAAGSDAVIFDLEAAVPVEQKPRARVAVCHYGSQLRRPDGPTLWVRVNSGGEQFEADLDGIDWSYVDGAIVARAEDPEVLQALSRSGVRRIVPLVETARGFARLTALAQVSCVERFAIGTWDLALDLGLFAIADPDHSELIWRLRADLVVASRQLRLRAPIDGVHAQLDGSQLRGYCVRAHELGYGSKLLIHPNQIEIARSVFGPDEQRLREAREVLDAYEKGLANGVGVVRVNGMMVDNPMAERARALLTRWPGALTS